jgi:hypothetical protein
MNKISTYNNFLNESISNDDIKNITKDIEKLYNNEYKEYFLNKYRDIQKIINNIINNFNDLEETDIKHIQELSSDLMYCKYYYNKGIIIYKDLIDSYFINISNISKEELYNIIFKRTIASDEYNLNISRNERFEKKSKENSDYYFGQKHMISDKRILKKFKHLEDSKKFDLI